mmetsp:Transcript_22837/g.64639  ORF Transcript_22837/g.64639 Transcript_22837/m.64639 type:complete len:261 (-) Transcript_22837:61-843(-)
MVDGVVRMGFDAIFRRLSHDDCRWVRVQHGRNFAGCSHRPFCQFQHGHNGRDDGRAAVRIGDAIDGPNAFGLLLHANDAVGRPQIDASNGGASAEALLRQHGAHQDRHPNERREQGLDSARRVVFSVTLQRLRLPLALLFAGCRALLLAGCRAFRIVIRIVLRNDRSCWSVTDDVRSIPISLSSAFGHDGRLGLGHGCSIIISIATVASPNVFISVALRRCRRRWLRCRRRWFVRSRLVILFMGAHGAGWCVGESGWQGL